MVPNRRGPGRGDGPLGPARRALVAKLSLRIEDRSVFWTRLRNATHIWAAPLPKDLEPGVHRFAVRAVDEYGQVHEASKLIEVTP